MPYIENCTITPHYNSAGVQNAYFVTPNEGYVLHDKLLDFTEVDLETFEEIAKLGFSPIRCSCPVDYDWTANEREFYAVLRTEVPENQIFGGGNNDHEVM